MDVPTHRADGREKGMFPIVGPKKPQNVQLFPIQKRDAFTCGKTARHILGPIIHVHEESVVVHSHAAIILLDFRNIISLPMRYLRPLLGA
jgi:hypothetical protein